MLMDWGLFAVLLVVFFVFGYLCGRLAPKSRPRRVDHKLGDDEYPPF
jgi:uncharacterized membrane-anchored protein YhcB (DUF1043 family)